jgi:hypothetical protein
VDTELANGWSGVVFGHALGQVFVAADTLVRSVTVWRTAIQDTNHAGIKLYITETDSTGYPKADAVILNGPIVGVPFGDGIHPVRFDFVFDPPFALPRRGSYCLAVQARPCDATWNILSSSLDPYPGGHLWDFGRSSCFLRTSPRPYPSIDLAFRIEFLHTIAVSFSGVHAEPCVLRLAWSASGAAGLAATVYRRSADADWGRLSEVRADLAGQIDFEDQQVTPGTRYGYRLGVEQCDSGVESLVAETWVDVPGDLRVELLSAVANPAGLRLTWSVTGGGALPATIYRRVAGGEWEPRSRQLPDEAGLLTYVDDHVTLGTGYRYRLGLSECGREVFVGETPHDVTPPGELRLEGLRPNPANGDLAVAFSVTGTAPAALEVLDLAGRRILSRNLGVMSPGNHVVTLGRERPFAAGVFFVRLTEGSRTLTARGVVIR